MMKLPLFITQLFCVLTALVVNDTSILCGNEKNNTYTLGTATRDGIGKFYMGREISKVIGHLGASWLERPKR